MRCLVLGGAGFIGSHIVDALVSGGHRVRVFDLPNISTKNLSNSMESVELMGGDFYNVKDMLPALDGMEVIFHLVGTTLPGPSNENPVYDVETNVVGTLRLLEGAVEQGVRKVIFASSGGTVYGVPRFVPIPETDPTNPICSYGITKLTIEKYLGLFYHLYGLSYTVLRLGNPYGERQRTDHVQGAVAVFLGKTLNDQTITIWGDGSVARDYFYVGDLVSAFTRVMGPDTKSKLYNIAGGRAYSLTDIISAIQRVTGKNPCVEFTSGRRLDVPVSCLDISRAREELGWQPRVSLEEGMARTWEWLKSGGC